MSGGFSLLLEVMVIALLGITIVYCGILDRRLRIVRQDEAIMRRTVLDLGQATERAERAIEQLRQALGDCDRTLADRLRAAERYSVDLEDQIRSGDQVLERITRIVAINNAVRSEANTPQSPATTPPPAPDFIPAPAPIPPSSQEAFMPASNDPAAPRKRATRTLAIAEALLHDIQNRHKNQGQVA